MKKFLRLNKTSKSIIYIFLIWKLAVLTTAFIAIQALSFKPSFPYSESILLPYGSQLFWSWGNFDGVHYISIAKSGYANQYTQAFFPLYPLLIKTLSIFIHNLLLSALFISHICLLVALFVFYKLIRLDFSRQTAIWSIVFLLAFPTSVFFASVYTESLFFLLLVSSFYFLRKQTWGKSSLFAVLASATRLVGIFIFPVLLWEYYKAKRVKTWKIRDLIAIFLSTSGFLIYALYLKINFGSFTYFATSQNIAWQREGFVTLPQVIYRYLKIFATTTIGSDAFLVALNEFVSTFFVILVLILAIRKIRTSYIIFSALAILTPTLTGTLSSMPRYSLLIFPVFIYLGSLKKWQYRYALLVVFILLSIFTISRFTTGRFVS